jgi:hypothetical protein
VYPGFPVLPVGIIRDAMIFTLHHGMRQLLSVVSTAACDLDGSGMQLTCKACALVGQKQINTCQVCMELDAQQQSGPGNSMKLTIELLSAANDALPQGAVDRLIGARQAC